MVLSCMACTASTPEGFWRKLTKSLCKYNDKCARDTADASVDECINRSYEDSQRPEDFAIDCDYQKEIGKSCLTYLYNARKECSELEPTPVDCENICGPGTGISFSFGREGLETVPRAYFEPGEFIELP